MSLQAANYISMSEILFSIQRDYEELRNEYNQYQGPISKFESRFGNHKAKIDLYDFYYEFTLTNQLRNWK